RVLGRAAGGRRGRNRGPARAAAPARGRMTLRHGPPRPDGPGDAHRPGRGLAGGRGGGVTPTALLYRAEHGVTAPAGDAVCWLCGAACPADGPRAEDVIRSTFNDHARARRGGDSDVICPACAWYFDHRTHEGHGATGKLFTYSLRVFASHWRPWERSEEHTS